MSELHFEQIERTPTAYAAMARLWEAACGPAFSVSDDFMAYNLHPTPGLAQEGQFAYREGVPLGFVVASALTEAPPEIPARRGWIDAVAVAPTAQERGIGSALLDWAEGWLRGHGLSPRRFGRELSAPFSTACRHDAGDAPVLRAARLHLRVRDLGRGARSERRPRRCASTRLPPRANSARRRRRTSRPCGSS